MVLSGTTRYHLYPRSSYFSRTSTLVATHTPASATPAHRQEHR
ncbi:hypothetical protein GA0115255_101774, partial [Streptomyces sp. Ncost-T6T-2b]